MLSTSATLRILHLRGVSILKQLILEESLYRSKCMESHCVLAMETPETSIVLGISGKPQELIHVNRCMELKIPVLRRFTGGGTVIVDNSTIFVSFILKESATKTIPSIQNKIYPRELMTWSKDYIYRDVFNSFNLDFDVRENDYVVCNYSDSEVLKIGGNAQAISGKNFVHHTSFLFKYTPWKMNLLQMPKKQPQYRQGRQHSDFVVGLANLGITSETQFISKVSDVLNSQFRVIESYYLNSNDDIDIFVKTVKTTMPPISKILSDDDLR